jgi:hypothetical protein
MGNQILKVSFIFFFANTQVAVDHLKEFPLDGVEILKTYPTDLCIMLILQILIVRELAGKAYGNQD